MKRQRFERLLELTGRVRLGEGLGAGIAWSSRRRHHSGQSNQMGSLGGERGELHRVWLLHPNDTSWRSSDGMSSTFLMDIIWTYRPT